MASVAGKNILITGGAGFIGSHLADALLERGAGKVVIVDNYFRRRRRITRISRRIATTRAIWGRCAP